MALLLAPCLHALPSSTGEWRFAIHVALVDQNPDDIEVSIEDGDAEVDGPHPVHDFAGQPVAVHRWIVTAPRGDTESTIRYSVGGDTYGPVAIPARSSLPRFAFFSCNGFSNPADVHKVRAPELLWRDMVERHERAIETPDADNRSGIHLLFGGGDQIYCDALWHRDPLERLAREDENAAVSGEDEAAILAQYIQWYVQNWGYPGFADAMSRIPGVFTWDDHDIFDGWGSHPLARQQTPLHQAVFRAAREAFLAFQIGGAGSPLLRRSAGEHLLQAIRLEADGQCADVIFLDLRSDRTRSRVLSDEQWADFQTELNGLADGDARERYLLVVSSIPVLYRGTKLESIPAGSLEDDRRDQWEHTSRSGERKQLIGKVFDALGGTARGAFVSGDVHVASRGRLTSMWPRHATDGLPGIVHQITSSPILHPAPGWLEWQGLSLFSDGDPSPGGERISAELDRMSAGDGFLRARNYVLGSFTTPDDGGPGELWFQWIHEDDPGGTPHAEALSDQVVIRGVSR